MFSLQSCFFFSFSWVHVFTSDLIIHHLFCWHLSLCEIPLCNQGGLPLTSAAVLCWKSYNRTLVRKWTSTSVSCGSQTSFHPNPELVIAELCFIVAMLSPWVSKYRSRRKKTPLSRQVECGECKLLQQLQPMEGDITKKVTKDTPRQCIFSYFWIKVLLFKLSTKFWTTCAFQGHFHWRLQAKKSFFKKTFFLSPQNLAVKAFKGSDLSVKGSQTSCISHLASSWQIYTHTHNLCLCLWAKTYMAQRDSFRVLPLHLHGLF